MLRITEWILKFRKKCKGKKQSGPIQAPDVESANNFLIKLEKGHDSIVCKINKFQETMAFGKLRSAYLGTDSYS